MADYNPLKTPRIPHYTVQFEREEVDIDTRSPDVKFNNDVADVTSNLFDLLISKHNDYGPKNISQSPGGPLNGLRVRMWDKFARINNLVDNNADPEHESLEDSFKDMANYAIIGLLVLQGKWPQE